MQYEGLLSFTRACTIALPVIFFSGHGYCSGRPLEVVEHLEAVLGVRFNETTLDDVRKMVGSADIQANDDASSSKSFICYRITNNDERRVIAFVSDNELAGSPEYELTGFEAYLEEQSPYKSAKCTEGKINSALARFLTMPESDFATMFGDLRARKHDGLFAGSKCVDTPMNPDDADFSYWSTRKDCFPDNVAPYASRCATWTAQFRTQALVEFKLSTVISVC